MSETKQKFHKGDFVRVAKDLGASMSHFKSDCDAIVIGSYADQYGGSDVESFTIHIKGGGRVSWYYGGQLTLIERDRMDLLHQWEAEAEADRKQKSDLDWIFAHGPDVLSQMPGASVEALAASLGITNLWGSRGEGFTYYSNAMKVLCLAAPFLANSDKYGWLQYAEHAKAEGR